MAASLRRLIKDHAALRNDPPPNYIFPDNEDGSSLPDDLTQLLVLITGAEGTPYAQGLWRLHLKIPEDYPKSPPKATFRTRIFHPNVEESTGAVCLETLKRDWDPKLTLKDILITISCLLIQPNPDSALNAAAGALIQDDYDAFSNQAKLMTRIHAPTPAHLAHVVREAKRRGEDISDSQDRSSMHLNDDDDDDTKENMPSQRAVRAGGKGKRPLAELPAPSDPDTDDQDSADNGKSIVTASSKTLAETSREGEGPPRKSPKLKHPVGTLVSSSASFAIAGDLSDKENPTTTNGKAPVPTPQWHARPTALRRVSNVGARRMQPRVGIRRL